MPKRINGIMIDCARLMEKHEYYFHLIDYMAQWGMNTLLLHFSDDHGCGVVLPGYEKLAMKNAFTAGEIHALEMHASTRGVQILPELEVFGHTRYITDNQMFEHLYAGKKTKKLLFNALDPFNPETHDLVRGLINSTAKMFSSVYLHLGCDEVDLTELCGQKGFDPEQTWSEYINRVIGYAHDAGKSPMIWADHLVHSKRIAGLVRKDVSLVHWEYEVKPRAGAVAGLKKAGFKKILTAPSIACYHSRFLVNKRNLHNTDRMIRQGQNNGVRDTINTIWCPYRYVQGALYFGIAYSAESVRGKGTVDLKRFYEKFAQKLFGVKVTPAFKRFLSTLPKADLPLWAAKKIAKKEHTLNNEQRSELKNSRDAAAKCIESAPEIKVAFNPEILESMTLAASAAWVCCEGLLIASRKSVGAQRKKSYKSRLSAVRKALSADWDKTRFPNDPLKKRPAFQGQQVNYAHLLVKSLPS